MIENVKFHLASKFLHLKNGIELETKLKGKFGKTVRISKAIKLRSNEYFFKITDKKELNEIMCA